MDETKEILRALMHSVQELHAKVDGGFRELKTQLRSYERRLRQVEDAVSEIELWKEERH
jgi:hypothetical protein